MIHSVSKSTAARQRRLQQLDDLHAGLGLEIGNAVPWRGQLRRFQDSVVAASLSIEGFQMSDGGSLDNAITGSDESGNRNRSAFACYARAMHHVSVMASDPDFAWNSRVILDLHFDACSFQLDKSPGQWRSGPMLVTRNNAPAYVAPKGGEVGVLINEVVEWLATGDLKEHVAVRAAMAHLHVASIHPFRDGNGRVARLVQSLVLGLSGILSPAVASIEPFLANDTSSYYSMLETAQGGKYDASHDASKWIDYCIDAHLWQAQQRINILKSASKRWTALEQIVESKGWPDRLVIALDQAATGAIDRASYMEQTGVAAPTASTDLRRLLDAGLIDQRGGGRTTQYVASSELTKLLATSAARSL